MAIKKYDVVIIGGGITGCACASEVAATGASVLIIEKYPRIGFCNATIVTYEDTIKRYGIRDATIIHYNKLSYKVFPEGTEYVGKEGLKGVKCGGSLLDGQKIIQKLCKKALDHDTDVLINEEVLSITKQDEGYELRMKHQPEPVYARVLVDASGGACVVSKMLHIYKEPKDKEYCYWLLTEHDNIKDPRHAYFEIKDFTRWYWIYPHNKTKSYIGISSPTAMSYNDVLLLLKDYLKRYGMEYKDAQVTQYGTGIYYNQIPNIYNSMVHENILFLGEAGGTDTPMMGEGFRPGIIASSILAKHIKKILAGKEDLRVVEREFYATVGKSYRVRRLLNTFLVQLDHEDAKKIVEDVLMNVSPKILYNWQHGETTNAEYVKLFYMTAQALGIRKMWGMTPLFYEVLKSEIGAVLK